MLQEGTKLMVVGMTTVLGFLAFIVIVLNVSARFFDVFGHRWLDADVVSKRSPTTPQVLQGSEVEVAVALAAIESHRRQR